MKIQNITGVSRLFALGRRSVQLAANQQVTLEDEPAVIEAVMKQVEAGKLKLLVSPRQSLSLYTRPVDVAFAVKPGALLRWADGDTLDIGGVIFEADDDATYTSGNLPVTDDLADLAGLEAAFDTSFGAATDELAAIGVTYVGKRALGAVSTFVFTLDTTVTAIADLTLAFTNAGGSGTAPTVVKPAALTPRAPQQIAIDAVVPTGSTKVVFNLPGDQILGTPVLAVFDADGVAVTYATAPTVATSSVEWTGLTAGHTVTMLAWIR